MFGSDPLKDLIPLLGAMQNEAITRCNSNQIEARAEMIKMVRQDRRLDGYDAERLVDRVRECGQSGRRLDWEDPYLKGGQHRPQMGRRTW